LFSTNTHSTNSIRFRHWSRQGYAAFCSLTCAVTIGALAVSVSDKTLQKSVSKVECIPASRAAKDDNEKESECTEITATILEIQLNTIQQNNSVTAATGTENGYSNIHQNG
jgi:hypothetical protein